MILPSRGTLLLLLMLLLSQGGIAYEKPDPLQQFLAGLDTLQSRFTQILIGTKGNVLEEATGVLIMQNPGKFYWSYQSPYIQSIITNGQTLWIYDEDLEQVTIKDVNETLNDSPAAILSGSENLDNHFTVHDKGMIEGVNMYELNPKNSENQFQSIHIGFHGEDLFLMVMYDNLGQVTRINFKDPVRNAAVDTKKFEFVPPSGVDIIDDRVKSATP